MGKINKKLYVDNLFSQKRNGEHQNLLIEKLLDGGMLDKFGVTTSMQIHDEICFELEEKNLKPLMDTCLKVQEETMAELNKTVVEKLETAIETGTERPLCWVRKADLRELIRNYKKLKSVAEAQIVEKQGKTYVIRGSENTFEKVVSEDEINHIAKDIWDHPSKYSDYVDGSDSSFYEFTKYLYIYCPDGTEIRLADFVNKL